MTEKNEGAVPAPAITQMGATFAERKAAREASEQGSKPEPKSVTSDEGAVEDKAITSSESKRTTRKKS